MDMLVLPAHALSERGKCTILSMCLNACINCSAISHCYIALLVAWNACSVLLEDLEEELHEDNASHASVHNQ